SAAAALSASTPFGCPLKDTAIPLVWSTSIASSAPGMAMTSVRQLSSASTVTSLAVMRTSHSLGESEEAEMDRDNGSRTEMKLFMTEAEKNPPGREISAVFEKYRRR